MLYPKIGDFLNFVYYSNIYFECTCFKVQRGKGLRFSRSKAEYIKY